MPTSIRDKVLEAKIVDLDDKLRVGMAAMQSAIGETDAKFGEAKHEAAVSVDEAERISQEHLSGIREDVAHKMARMEEKFTDLKTDVNRQEETINNKFRVVRLIKSCSRLVPSSTQKCVV